MTTTLLGTHYSAAGGPTARVVTLSTPSTPGRSLIVVAKHLGAAVLSSVSAVSGSGVSPVFVGGAGSNNAFWILPSGSHPQSVSQVTLTFSTTDAALSVVVMETDESVYNVWFGSTSGSSTNYTPTSWTTDTGTRKRKRSVAVFFASMQTNTETLPSFDATGFDKGHVEIADTGGGGALRMWAAVADNLDFTDERITVTTTDSTGIYLAETMHICFDVNPPSDIVNKQMLRTLDASGLDKTMSWDFTPTAGNKLVVVAEAYATFTTPVGWTRVPQEYLSDYAFVAFTKTSDGTETGITWTQNGPRTAVGAVWELPAGSVAQSLGDANDIGNYPTDLTGPIGPYAERTVWLAGVTRGNEPLLVAPTSDVPLDAIASLLPDPVGLSALDVTIPTGETRQAAWTGGLAAGDFRAFQFVVTVGTPPPPSYTNVIQEENDKPGSTDHGSDSVGNGTVGYLGFVRQFSTDAGNPVQFSVDGMNADSIDIYRLGYYGGNHFRKVATIDNTGTAQSGGTTIPASNGGTTMAAWSVTATWSIPVDTVSGMFVGAVKDSGGTVRAWIPFVVRNDLRDADIVVKMSDSTWGAAYNYFGDQGSEKTGKSVYGSGGPLGDITTRTYAVSYDRPIVSRGPDAGDNVVNHFDNHESALIAYLEENAFDVKYISCYDLDQQNATNVLGTAKVLISDGHDEYWSQGMWDNAVAFRNAGGHLIFQSGNAVFWRVRWADGGRTMWCYKDTMPGPDAHAAGTPLDPVSWTGTWRDTRWAGRTPENLLTGTHFVMNGIYDRAAAFESALFGSNPFWRNTPLVSLNQNISLVIGFEADRVAPPNPGYAMLARTRYDISGSYAEANGENYNGDGIMDWGVVAFYATATSGLTVGFGTCQWSWGLSNRHRRGSPVANDLMRQATRNLLTDMGCSAALLPGGLVDVAPVALSTYGATYVDQTTVPQEQTFPATVPGSVAAFTENVALVVGTKFSSNKAGHITKIHVYKHSTQDWSLAGEVKVRVSRLAPARSNLRDQVVSVGTETGWLTFDLADPVPVVPGSMYAVSLVCNADHQYSGAPDSLAKGRASYDLFSPGSVYITGDAFGIPTVRSDAWYGVDPVLDTNWQGNQHDPGSIWYPVPQSATSATDNNSVATLTRFEVTASGTIQRIYYWKAWSGNQSPVPVFLIDATNSQVLGQITADWGTETGWVYADLPAPVPIVPGRVYGAGILFPGTDQFSIKAGVFPPSITRGTLVGLGGAYKYTTTVDASGYFLASEARSYFVDVLLNPVSPPPATGRPGIGLGEKSVWTPVVPPGAAWVYGTTEDEAPPENAYLRDGDLQIRIGTGDSLAFKGRKNDAWIDLMLPGGKMPYDVEVDEFSATVTYVGEAQPGTAATTAGWRIKRITDNGGSLSIDWAGGTANLVHAWSNRYSLIYGP